jgi:hypothetical protein
VATPSIQGAMRRADARRRRSSRSRSARVRDVRDRGTLRPVSSHPARRTCGSAA